jgi:N-acyl-D-aspartate/D-glutamate deacylase
MSYDLVIKNGIVVDGTGAKRYQAGTARSRPRRGTA